MYLLSAVPGTKSLKDSMQLVISPVWNRPYKYVNWSLIGDILLEILHELLGLAAKQDGNSIRSWDASTLIDSPFPFHFFLFSLPLTPDVAPETHFSLSVSDRLFIDLYLYYFSVNTPT